MTGFRLNEVGSSVDLTDLLAPHLLPLAPSAWHELIPVAHWLVKSTRPRILVELGTHAGVSFSAFCSAMRRHSVAGNAFAVDTWRGDEHAGHYEESVYEKLRDFINSDFGDFAQLLRLDFRAASDSFSESSVDFLHVDGFHTYDAVKHDFETWLGKLSERSVVIFHNTNCRNPGFGVWRFWEEISRRYPSFEFLHGNGLGLVAVGSEPPPLIRALTSLSDVQDIERVREWFALAGRSHGSVYEAHIQGEERLALLRSDRERVSEDRDRIDHERVELLAQQKLLEIKIAQERQKVAALQAELDGVRLQAEDAEARISYLKREISALMQKYLSLTSSLSWRGTRPLRSIGAKAGLSTAQADLVKRAFDPKDVDARRILLSSLRRRLGFKPSPLVSPLLPPPPPEVNAEDKVIIASLLEQGEIPSMSALVVMGDADQSRLEIIVRALDEQIVPVRQIIVNAATGSSASTMLETLMRERIDVRVAWDDGVAIVDVVPVDALLVLSATCTPKPQATAVFATEMSAHDADLVYSDEIFVSPDGGARDPFYKPAYSPRLAASSNYIGQCALVAIRKNDTPNRFSEIISGICEARCVSSYLTRLGADSAKEKVHRSPFVLFEETDPGRELLPAPTRTPSLRRDQRVAILIPTRDRLNLLEPCIESILAKTDYPREAYEIIVIDNGTADSDTLRYLEEGQSAGKFRVLRDEGDFNYARLNNLGARATTAEVLLFLNNDTLIIQPDWLARLVEGAMHDDVGLVGAKLLYEDETIQHGGVILGIQGAAAHADVHLPSDTLGYHGLARHDREISAVTGACMATRRDHFWSVGGFDENLAVAFNDILLCVSMLEAGLVNLLLNSVQVTHLESKSRGLDDTQAKRQKFLAECRYTRKKGQVYFLNDQYYNPNLSLHEVYQPAIVTRRRKPWRSPAFKRTPRVLILSCTHQRGHGVPVVIERHAGWMTELDWDVHIGGPITPSDHVYKGCSRVAVESSIEALRYALEQDIDIVLPHTPPFFSVSRGVGPYPVVAAYDYGEPPPYLFSDAQDRWDTLQEKIISLSMSHRIYGISKSVKDEAGFDSMAVVPLGNSHMSHWSPDKASIRRRIREAYGWSEKVIVLNVCRFHKTERQYKGVDFFVDVSLEAKARSGLQDPSVVFVQCGKADEKDVAFVQSAGLEAFPNVTDEEMMGLYCAADVYANFSQWEGWSLGIAQALAYGLPVVASDILAHRKNFDVATASSPAEAWSLIAAMARKVAAADFEPRREAFIDEWEPKLKFFTDDLLDLWQKS